MKLGYKIYSYKHHTAYYLVALLPDGTSYQIGNSQDKQEIVDKLEENGINFNSLKLTKEGIYL